MTINQANMLKVAQALRSGEFTQAKGALRRVDPPKWIVEALADESHEDHQTAKNDNESTIGYCCLGVACEVAVREGIVSRRVYGSDSPRVSTAHEYGDFSEDNPAYSDSFLPDGVQAWLGVPSGDILFKLEGDKLEKALNAGISFYKRTYERDGYLIVSASTLNDRMGFTFNDMADLFESGKVMNDDLSDAQELERV